MPQKGFLYVSSASNAILPGNLTEPTGNNLTQLRMAGCRSKSAGTGLVCGIQALTQKRHCSCGMQLVALCYMPYSTTPACLAVTGGRQGTEGF